MRMFLAVPPPPSWLELQQEVRATVDGEFVRWTRPENLHLTLYFIGDTRLESADPVSEAVAPVFSDTAPFSLEPDSICTAGHPDHPSMLWLRFKPDEGFVSLHHRLHEVLHGFSRSGSSAYSQPIPHVTLARFKKGTLASGAFSLKNAFDLPVRIEGAQLWHTTHDGQGVLYRALGNYRFGS